MRKKIILPFLIGLMVLSGCGKSEDVAAIETPNETNVDIEDESIEATEESVDVQDETESQIDEETKKIMDSKANAIIEANSEKEGFKDALSYESALDYAFKDINGDGIDEFITGSSLHTHGSTCYIFTQNGEGEYEYYGYFGSNSTFYYVEGGNALVGSFGNQGFFPEIYVKMGEDGFEYIGSSVRYYPAVIPEGEEAVEYFKVGFIPEDVSEGVDMNTELTSEGHGYEDCTEEEYLEYQNQLYETISGDSVTALEYDGCIELD